MFFKYLSVLIKNAWRGIMRSKWDVLIVFIMSTYGVAVVTLTVTGLYPKLLTILMIPFVFFLAISCILMILIIIVSLILALSDSFKKQVKQYKRWKETYQREIKK